MKRIFLLLPLFACACSTAQQPSTYTPVITVNPNGTATSTPSAAVVPSGDPLAQLASDLGVKFGADDVAFVNLSGGSPPADPVGYAFATDLANLSNAIKSQNNPTPLGQPGVLSTVEASRLALMALGQSTDGNPLVMQTLADGIAWGRSTYQMGLALPPEFMLLMNQLQVAAIQGGAPVGPVALKAKVRR